MENLKNLSEYEISHFNGGYWPNPYSYLPGYRTVVAIKEFCSGVIDGVSKGYEAAPKY